MSGTEVEQDEAEIEMWKIRKVRPTSSYPMKSNRDIAAAEASRFPASPEASPPAGSPSSSLPPPSRR